MIFTEWCVQYVPSTVLNATSPVSFNPQKLPCEVGIIITLIL